MVEIPSIFGGEIETAMWGCTDRLMTRRGRFAANIAKLSGLLLLKLRARSEGRQSFGKPTSTSVLLNSVANWPSRKSRLPWATGLVVQFENEANQPE
jgi:hypothetical protein